MAGIAGFAEIARRRLARTPSTGTDSSLLTAATVTAGMLSGWGISATGVNLAAMLAGEGVPKTERAQDNAGLGLLLGLGAIGTAATAATKRAAPGFSKIYAATLLWGLTGIAIGQRSRSRRVARGAAAAIPVVLAAARRTPAGRGTRRAK